MRLPKCPRCKCKKDIEETTTVFDKEQWFRCPNCGCRYRTIDTYAGDTSEENDALLGCLIAIGAVLLVAGVVWILGSYFWRLIVG